MCWHFQIFNALIHLENNWNKSHSIPNKLSKASGWLDFSNSVLWMLALVQLLFLLDSFVVVDRKELRLLNLQSCLRRQTVVISVVTLRVNSLPAGTTLQRQPVHSGREVGSSGRGGAGRTGTSRRLEWWPGEPEKSRDGWREGGAQEEGGVIREEQQHVTGMWDAVEGLGWNAFSFVCNESWYRVLFTVVYAVSYRHEERSKVQPGRNQNTQNNV